MIAAYLVVYRTYLWLLFAIARSEADLKQAWLTAGDTESISKGGWP